MSILCPPGGKPVFLPHPEPEVPVLSMHVPSEDRFHDLAIDHDFVPVFRRLLSDRMTPVSAFRLLQANDDAGGVGSGGACLFESVIGGEKVGRYSFLAANPFQRFCATRQNVSLTQFDADGTSQVLESFTDPDPLNAFRKYFCYRVAQLPGVPPFVGGAIGYAGYDVVRYVEDLPDAPEDDRELPDLDFAFYHTLCVFDHVEKTICVISLADCRDVQTKDDAMAAYRAAAENVDSTVDKLSAPLSQPAHSGHVDPADHWNPEAWKSADEAGALEVTSNFTRESFCQAVKDCVEYIRAGDIFQVVPSQRLSVKTDVDPLEIYRSLRVVNPSPFMFFVRTPECVLVGCSPEIMCRVADRVVTVRPLAGTRRRGSNEKEDKALERELLADPKERAEHVMLVDLGRNDVGRVAKFGTVDLTEIMVVERYSHVMHISSEVQGELRDDLDAFDALKACLPAGTVSGAPKVRAMEVIDSIEPHRRGPYGGAVGYIDYRGNMDTCIALRTMVVKDDTVYVQAGCGVVADSDPDAEYEETLNKAKALISAIELTVRRVREV